MKGDTVLSANVTIKAPVKNVCDVSQLRDWKGGVDISDKDAFYALVTELIAENGLSTMVGQERVEIVAVEMEVAE
jgi:hypothetical protein